MNNSENKQYGWEKIKQKIYNLYKNSQTILVAIGLLIYFYYFIFKLVNKIKFEEIFIFITGIWMCIFVRLLLLTLIDISSFPAMHALYLGPAFPMLTMAALLPILLIPELIPLHFNFFQTKKKK